MVEQFQVEEASRRRDLRRETHILFRRFGIPTRVVVHQRKANTTKIQDGTEELSNPNARPCCGAYIDLTQRKETVATVHHRHVQLLVISPRQERHCERREIGGRLHALTGAWPPGRCSDKRSHHALDAIGITRAKPSANQASTDLWAEEDRAFTRDRVVEAIGETRKICERFNGAQEHAVMGRST